MAGISGNTSFELDGKTTVDVGEYGHFEWFVDVRNWMGPVDIGAAGPVDPGIDVNVTLSGGNWDMHTLRFNGGAQFDVKIRDNTTKGTEPVWIERIGLSHGSSDVVLTNASVQFINGGRGDDDITTGSGFYSQVRLNIGNNKFKSGAGWVDSITAGDGNDKAIIGDGGAGQVKLNGGNNTFTTGKGFVDSIVALEGDDEATIGGEAGSVNLGHGDNTFTTGKGWVSSLVAYNGNDKATIGAGGAGSVNLNHGDNIVTTGEGWVDSIVTRDGDDVVNVGSGGLGFANLGDGNDRLVLARQDNKDWLVAGQGGGDTDTVDFSALSRGIDWDIFRSYAETRDGTFLLVSFENVIGTKKSDELTGDGNDNDLDGGKGKDKITGGEGADNLTGGASKDTFIFVSASDSTVGGKGRDEIADFKQGQKDKIDLKAIDAIAGGSDNKFSFIGSADFSNTAGELRFEQDDDVTTVYGDTDGDGSEDFAIDLAGLVNLKAGDFVL